MIKNILTLLLVVILGLNCSQSPTSKNMKTNESDLDTKATTRERNMKTVRDFFELMHRKDLKKWNDLWDENGFIYIPYPVSNFPIRSGVEKRSLKDFKTYLLVLKALIIKSRIYILR